MKRIYIILPFPVQNVPGYLLLKLFENKGYEVKLIGTYATIDRLLLSIPQNSRTLLRQVEYVIVSLFTIFKSNSHNILLFRQDIMGIYAAFLCRLFFLKRHLIITNLMFNPQNSLVFKLTNFALRGGRSKITLTVNSKASRELYQKLLPSGYKNNLKLLYDDYGNRSYLIEYNNVNNQARPRVFCGGYNGRDWKFMFQLARECPQWDFTFIGAKNFFKEYYVPSNTTYYEDVKQDVFIDIIRQSSIVCFASKTDAPSGLLLLFIAALLQKPVVLTDSEIIREYIPIDLHANTLFVRGDLQACIKLINNILRSDQQEKWIQLQRYVVDTFSPESYVDQLCSFIID